MGKASGTIRRALAAAAIVGMLGLGAPATANEYDPQTAGHPVRILAYLVHPVGVAFDYLILRPAHWVGTHEPFATIFGHELED